MAYQAQINIKTTGLAGLNKINASVDRINKAIIQINKGGSKIKGGKDIAKINEQDLKTKKEILKVETDIANQLQRQKTLRGKKGAGGATGTGGSKTGGGIDPKGLQAALTSGAISGAFPLLFGQGLLGGAFGFAGGFAGTKLGGQMGGFAGGLIATAVLQQIQGVLDGAKALGQALSPLVQDTAAVTTALSLQGSVQEAQLKRIEETEGKTAAFNAAMKLMGNRIDQEGINKLKNFGETTRLLGQQFSIALIKLQAFAGGLANFVITLVAGQNKLQEAENQRIVKDAASLKNTEAQDILNQRNALGTTDFNEGVTGSRKRFANKRKKEAEDEVKALEKNFAIRSKVEAKSGNIATEGDLLIQNLEKEIDLRKRIEQNEKTMTSGLAEKVAKVQQEFDNKGKILQQTLEQMEKERELFKLTAEKNGLTKAEKQDIQDMNTGIEHQKTLIQDNNKVKGEAVRLTKELDNATNKIDSNFEKIGQSIASGVSDNLTAAIQGTKTLGDAAKSILNDLSSTLIRLGVNTILGSFLPGFGSLPNLLPRARGGPVNKGGNFLVGEKGPELFVPRRSGTIIPNDKLGGGSTNISVNVDASGSAVEGDDSQSRELGRLISVAIQSELLKQRRPGGLLR